MRHLKLHCMALEFHGLPAGTSCITSSPWSTTKQWSQDPSTGRPLRHTPTTKPCWWSTHPNSPNTSPVRWIASGTPQSLGSHRISNANSSANGSAAEMGLRGTEKAERKREWLEKWLHPCQHTNLHKIITGEKSGEKRRERVKARSEVWIVEPIRQVKATESQEAPKIEHLSNILKEMAPINGKNEHAFFSIRRKETLSATMKTYQILT